MLIWIAASVGLLIIALAIIFIPSDSAIPPTPAFSRVTIGNLTFLAESYNDVLDLTGVFILNGTSYNGFAVVTIDGNSIIADSPEDTLVITTPGHLSTSIIGNNVTIKLTQMTCPILQGIKGIDENGNFVCAVI